MKARRTEINLLYNKVNISADISQYLLDFSYDDNEDKSDDLQIKLEDKESLWNSEWFPTKGSTIQADILMINHEKDNQILKLPCGIFEIDSVEAGGPPNQVTIKALSLPASNNINHSKKSKAWEKVKFTEIVKTISKANSLGLLLDIKEDKEYLRIDQNKESDLKFLERLCKDLNYSIKVSNLKLVIIDNEKYNNTNTTRVITKGEASILSYGFSDNSMGAYESANVTYKDTKTGKTKKAKVKNKVDHKTKKELNINERVESEADAKKKGQSKLEEGNKISRTANFTLIGDINLYTKQNIEVKGWGNFDGKYTITKSSHNVSGSGYITSIEASKV